MKKDLRKTKMHENDVKIIGVLFPIPIDKIFDYTVSEKFFDEIEIGKRVRVEFGSKKMTAIIYKIYEKKIGENIDIKKLKPILKVLDKNNFFTQEMLNLAETIKNYYLCSIGESLWSFLPKATSTTKDYLDDYFESEKIENYYSKEFLMPNKYQKIAIEKINDSILRENKNNENTFEKNITNEKIKKNPSISRRGNARSFLLFGVAGSGKTEVYLNSIKTALEIDKEVIYLVPEISLTPQTLIRLKSRFGDKVGVLHSKMPDSQRFLVLEKILDGEIKILLGARSAIFAPFRNLGLIIIDEEQEDSYKQEPKPSYDARKIAYWRAQMNNATLVFGSATPSVETFYIATNRKDNFEIFELPYKASDLLDEKTYLKEKNAIPMLNKGTEAPKNEIEAQNKKSLLNKRDEISKNEVSIIDMKFEFLKKNFSVISDFLKKNIEDKLNKNEQVLLFLNRRGNSTFVFCRKCGFIMKCPKCDVSLIYHSDDEKLRCHYCGYSVENVKECPECKSHYIKYFGNAIQKVEKEIKKLFPFAKIARFDKDTFSEDRNYNFEIYKAFQNKKIDILLGTQMLAKGFDFKNLSLVGVVSADVTLNLSDFRASERTFNLLVQVLGRAGRENKGTGIIQTYYPENYTILNAKNLDYLTFYKQEIEWRKELNYPPFSKLVLINFRGKDNESVQKKAQKVYEILKNNEFLKDKKHLEIIGAYQPVIKKKNSNFRWQILIKIIEADIFNKDLDTFYCQKIDELVKLNKNDKKAIKVSIIVDPVQMI
ncbi:MAG: primosomal protein N' [Elusimicrobiota bacterium]|nr:primosomal protein N' [Elusimicrobiota bacterium]